MALPELTNTTPFHNSGITALNPANPNAAALQIAQLSPEARVARVAQSFTVGLNVIRALQSVLNTNSPTQQHNGNSGRGA